MRVKQAAAQLGWGLDSMPALGTIVKLPAGDAPPAGCPAYRFLQVSTICAAPPPEEGTLDAHLHDHKGKVEEMVFVSYALSPFLSGRELELADVVLMPALANQELDDVFGAASKGFETNSSELEAFARIASHEVKRAQSWHSLPKRWREVTAWGVQLALCSTFCVTIILYALTDERLAEPYLWFSRVMLPVAEVYAAEIAIVEPGVALISPLLIVLLSRLPDDVRYEIQYTIVAPFVNRVTILTDLLAQLGL
jgi:hypothetical protein